ncbi:LysR family transcriptional regulator [Streptomyces sp. NPDC008001]|uniref:LysR family transcriptional regulator n=1 Tax=Streptomyces sp. NPDC008001 TaxID=3364804 RepID=UPI0036E2A085
MLNLRRLKYFVVLARELHFGRAAEALGITQSALSQQVKALEKDVGADLITGRGAKGPELTEAGRELVEGADRILSLCDDLTTRLHDVATGRAGSIALAYSLSGASLGQQDIVEAFRKRFPAVRVETDSGCSARNLDMLLDGQVDVAFIRQEARCPEVDSFVLAEEELVAVLPSGHRLGSSLRVAREQLRDEPLVMWPRKLAPELYDRIVGQVWGDGAAPRIVQEEPDYESVCSFVERGSAVAVMDRRVAERFVRHGMSVRRFTAPVPVTKIALAWRRATRSLVVANFLSVARANRHQLVGSHRSPRGLQYTDLAGVGISSTA